MGRLERQSDPAGESTTRAAAVATSGHDQAVLDTRQKSPHNSREVAVPNDGPQQSDAEVLHHRAFQDLGREYQQQQYQRVHRRGREGTRTKR